MTEIGVVGLDRVFQVDSSGGLGILGKSVTVDWWVGADDRWHMASQEIAVRQSADEANIMAETRLRVPGGDVVGTVFAVPHGAETIAVMEVENQTPVPVALAIVLSVDGRLMPEGDAILVNGQPVFRAGRSIARAAVSADTSSLLATVETGQAIPPAELQPVDGRNLVAAIFPLPHTAKISAVMSIDPVESLPPPSEVPTAEAVARGWGSHTGGGARLEVADQLVGRAVDSARRHLLVGAFSEAGAPFWTEGVEPITMPLAAVALEMWGHPREAHELLISAVGSDDLARHARRGPAETGALLWCMAETLERRSEPELEAALVPWVQEAAVGLMSWRRKERSVEDDAWRAVGLASAASLLTRATDAVYGQDFVDALPELLSELSPQESALAMVLAGRRLNEPSSISPIEWLATRLDLDDKSLAGVLAHASPTGAIVLSGRLQHPLASALLLISVRTAAVDEPQGAGGVVALLPRPEQAWLGAPIEGHDIPVSSGVVSFAVRWHGTRPALLWDLQAGQDQPLPPVTSPALDPDWRDERPRAEALLAESPDVELMERPHRGSGPGRRLDATDDPQSFD
ncbi:MAG: hypothetical protein ACR2PK_14370 [Acidimicrobiales bacterium]